MMKDFCEPRNELMLKFKEELGKGFDNLNGEDAGKLTDMIKDLAEAEKNMYEAMYYQEVICAMQEKQGTYDPYMEDRMGYNPNRGADGRYQSSRMGYHMQDRPYLDRYLNDDRMGYSSDRGGGRSMSSGSGRMGFDGELMDKYEQYRMEKMRGNHEAAEMYAKAYIHDMKNNMHEMMQQASPEMKKEILKAMEEIKA